MDSKRKRWKKHCDEHDRVAEQWRQQGYSYPPPDFPQLPDDLRDLYCGARAKSTGKPCKRRDIYSNGRCKLHGGLSTGPKTIKGKHNSSRNGTKKKAKSMKG